MPRFEWQRRPTRHFGDIWVPIAEVPIQALDGRLRTIAMQIDSGAIVSLLRRSAGELLGVVPEKGRPIRLFGLGGNATQGFVHTL